MTNLILIGLPFCGKSTLGKALSDAWRLPFIDTDVLIEDSYFQNTNSKLSCRLITQQHGLFFFRELEKQQLSRLVDYKKHIIATGGGSVLDPQNRHILRQIGHLVYLQCSPDIIWKRIQSTGSLPSYLDPEGPEKSLFSLAEVRTPIYEAAADFIIDISTENIDNAMRSIWQAIHLDRFLG